MATSKKTSSKSTKAKSKPASKATESKESNKESKQVIEEGYTEVPVDGSVMSMQVPKDSEQDVKEAGESSETETTEVSEGASIQEDAPSDTTLASNKHLYGEQFPPGQEPPAESTERVTDDTDDTVATILPSVDEKAFEIDMQTVAETIVESPEGDAAFEIDMQTAPAVIESPFGSEALGALNRIADNLESLTMELTLFNRLQLRDELGYKDDIETEKSIRTILNVVPVDILRSVFNEG